MRASLLYVTVILQGGFATELASSSSQLRSFDGSRRITYRTCFRRDLPNSAAARQPRRTLMWRQILAALLLSAITVAIHSTGVYAGLQWVLRSLKHRRSLSLAYAWGLTIRLVVVLLVLHSLEAAVWSRFYIALHCFSDRQTAYYFSLVTYTTLGYGDVLLPHPWKILGGWEAMVGVLMFGWSTASLVSFIHHVIGARIKFVLPPME